MEAKHGLMKDPALYLDALWPYHPFSSTPPQQFYDSYFGLLFLEDSFSSSFCSLHIPYFCLEAWYSFSKGHLLCDAFSDDP